MRAFRDISGQQFGCWTALWAYPKRAHRNTLWHCRCSCGVERAVGLSNLTTGSSQSCGCSRRQPGYRKKVYLAWRDMLRRCEDRQHPRFIAYGAKGIQVCARWHQFSLFLKDMGDCPIGKRSLGRIDNNKGYEPKNCRWETSTEQNRNRKNTVFVTVKGETRPLVAWAEQMGLSWHTLYSRYRRGLWP